MDGRSFVFVFLQEYKDADGAYERRDPNAAKHAESVKFNFIQAKEAHEDIVEQKACLIYRHDFNLVIILDTIVDVDHRYSCSRDQHRHENE